MCYYLCPALVVYSLVTLYAGNVHLFAQNTTGADALHPYIFMVCTGTTSLHFTSLHLTIPAITLVVKSTLASVPIPLLNVVNVGVNGAPCPAWIGSLCNVFTHFDWEYLYEMV